MMKGDAFGQPNGPARPKGPQVPEFVRAEVRGAAPGGRAEILSARPIMYFKMTTQAVQRRKTEQPRRARAAEIGPAQRARGRPQSADSFLKQFSPAPAGPRRPRAKRTTRRETNGRRAPTRRCARAATARPRTSTTRRSRSRRTTRSCSPTSPRRSCIEATPRLPSRRRTRQFQRTGAGPRRGVGASRPGRYPDFTVPSRCRNLGEIRGRPAVCAQRGAGVRLNISAKSWRNSRLGAAATRPRHIAACRAGGHRTGRGPPRAQALRRGRRLGGGGDGGLRRRRHFKSFARPRGRAPGRRGRGRGAAEGRAQEAQKEEEARPRRRDAQEDEPETRRQGELDGQARREVGRGLRGRVLAAARRTRRRRRRNGSRRRRGNDVDIPRGPACCGVASDGLLAEASPRTVRGPKGWSRGDAAATTWIFRGDLPAEASPRTVRGPKVSGERAGRPRSGRGDAAAATRTARRGQSAASASANAGTTRNDRKTSASTRRRSASRARTASTCRRPCASATSSRTTRS